MDYKNFYRLVILVRFYFWRFDTFPKEMVYGQTTAICRRYLATIAAVCQSGGKTKQSNPREPSSPNDSVSETTTIRTRYITIYLFVPNRNEHLFNPILFSFFSNKHSNFISVSIRFSPMIVYFHLDNLLLSTYDTVQTHKVLRNRPRKKMFARKLTPAFRHADSGSRFSPKNWDELSF